MFDQKLDSRTCENMIFFQLIFSDAEQVFLLLCSHSDTNLVELGEETIKEDDRAVLLEGGLSRSASAKFSSSSIKLNLMRFFP